MRAELLAAIPEFDLITDVDLRERTIRTWELAMQEGGWTLEDLARMPFTLLINPCPVNFIEHTRAVAQIAIEVARVFAHLYGDRVPVDMDILISGGILRDVGKLVEYEEREVGVFVQTEAGKLLRHPFTGMELAARCGLPAAVQHIIATHASEGDKVQRTTEATIVNHADFISFHAVQRLAEGKLLVSSFSAESR
ncbi:MAG: HDIG domain-containing protein [Anaerolineae bacterium]|nr:HDIG domain-containing protein [Anaerolineae bacterium]